MWYRPTARHSTTQPGNTEFGDHHERVERIAVLAQRAVDVAVVIRVAHRGEQGTVQEDAAGLVVDFVLVLGAARNFHDDVEGFCHVISP
jgi:hypothetical protein